MRNYRYIINEKKRTVVCVLETDYGVFRGIAKCSPEDSFDKNVGSELARKKAVLQANLFELDKLNYHWPNDEVAALVREISKNMRRKLAVKNNIVALRKEIDEFKK